MRRSRLESFLTLIAFAFISLLQLPLNASTNTNVPPQPWTVTGEIATGSDGNLWFTEFTAGKIGRITPGGVLTEFPVPGAAVLRDIVAGPDGNLWFTDSFSFASPYVGRITTTGTITKFPVGHTGTGITKGPDGALWIAEQDGFLGRITTSGVYTEFPTGAAGPYNLTTGPDGNLWFTSADFSVVGKMTTAGLVTLYPIPSGGLAFSITAGPDGNVWFTEGNFCGNTSAANAPCVTLVAKITPNGQVTEYSTSPSPPTPPAQTPHDITLGPDNRLWFKAGSGSNSFIGAIDTNGNVSQYLTKQGTFPRVAGARGIVSGPGNQLWLLGGGGVASVNTSGVITAVNPIPPGIAPAFITSGPDGNLWFTTEITPGFGKITPTGTLTTFPDPNPSCSFPEHIVSGSDGNLWFADGCGVTRVAPANGAANQFPITNAALCGPFGIASGSDGNLWITDQCAAFIYKFTIAGVETDFPIPAGPPGTGANAITSGPDGNLWYANGGTNSIGRITTAGVVTEFPLPAGASAPYAITTGPDGNLWFADDDATGTVGKITTAGAITIYTPTGAMNGFSFGGCAQDIISGPDGNLWVGNFEFCIGATQDVYAINTSGVVQMITGPNLPANPSVGLVTGPDHKLWLAGFESGTISRMSAISGNITVTPPSNPTVFSASATATFVDGTSTALPTDMTANVDWGDHTGFSVSVSGSTGGPFTVTAPSHSYIQPGKYQVTITLHDTVDNQDYPLSGTTALGQPTQTAIYSSTNPAAIGTILTLTARVAPAPGGSGTPTGIVTFQDQGFIPLGTANLDASGYASFSTSSLTVAPSSHSITAVYSGDTTFLGSTSPALNESVRVSQGFLFKDNAGKSSVGSNPVDAAIGDFNRDGIPDFALADSSNNAVGIFLGNGDGTFTAGPVYTLPGPPSALVAADFNGDGKTDLIVGLTSGTSDLVFLPGNGDGTFQTASLSFIGTDTAAVTALAVGDFNHDGKLDLEAADSTGTLTTYLGVGNGTFTSPGSVTTGGFPTQILVADFNKDGIPDIIFSPNGANGLTVALGKGDGTFPTSIPTADLASPYRMAIADLNRDGNLDVVVTDAVNPNLYVFLGNGTGNFAAPVSYPIGDTSCYPGIFDVNHDGIPDVGMPCPVQGGGFFIGNGDGTLQPFLQAGGGQGTPEAVIKLLVADFNRDGTLDVLTVNGPPDSNAGVNLFVSPGPLEPTWGVSSYTFGTNPWDVTAGDFRNNGKLDVAVTDLTLNKVDVLLNNGSGVLGAPTSNAVNNGPTGILQGDLNFDGKLDLIALTNVGINPAAEVLLGNADGSFQSGALYGIASAPQSAVLADFNGDGNLDVAATTASGISVLLGNGNGTFQTSALYPFNVVSSNLAYGITSGDFNGDGKIDLAVAVNGDNSINVFLGNGDGTFQPAVRYPLPANLSGPVTIKASDFNRDGKLDLAFTARNGNSVGVMLGNGDGTFQNPAVYPLPPTGNTAWGMTLLDANRDGKLDIAVADTTAQYVVLLEGNGDGSFRVAGTYPIPSPSGNAGPRNITTGDLNGDGVPDLITADEFRPGVSVLMSNQKTSTVTSYSACNTPDAVALGDFNGDGVADMAVVNAGCNSVTIRLGNGDGTFQSSTASYMVQGSPSAIALGDFNGDGRLDLAVTNKGSNSVSVLLGNGDGTFTLNQNYTVGTAPSSISVSDVNKDGKLDLVVANSGDGTLSILFGNGNGTFQNAVTVASMHRGPTVLASSLTNPLAVSMGDLNGDHVPDMVVADSGNNDIAVLLNSGAGTFPNITTYSTGSGSQPSALALGSFRGNGQLDIAVADAGTNDVAIFLNNGNGTFPANPAKYAVGHIPSAIAVLDYNSDGHLDIVVANSGDNTVMVLLGNGDGTFQSPITIATGTSPNGLAIGNLTGGGNGDMVVTNGNSGSVSVLLNAAAVLLGASSSGTSVYGQPATLTANVAPAVKSTRIPTGTVTFQSGQMVLGHAVLDNQGTGTLITSLIPGGTNTVTFTYSGNNFFNQQIASIFQIVTPAPPNITIVPSANQPAFGQPLMLKAIVSSKTGVGVPTGTVSFTDSVQGSLGSATLDGTGAGSVTVTTLSVGPHSITATYHGDSNFTVVTSNALSLTVVKQKTNTTLSVSNDQTFFNQSVVFDAHVIAIGTPTGNVAFMDGSTLLATVKLSGTGDAQFTTSALAVGSHNITAEYSGDSNFGDSSAGLTQTVSKAPTTLEIVSSQNPSTVAAPAQFLVTVKGLYGGTPAGTIAFTDSATALPGSPVTLSNGAAMLQPSLAAGAHIIHATYTSTDGNFLGGIDSVVQEVNNGTELGTNLALAVSPNPAYFRQSVTFTADLTLQSGTTTSTPTGTIDFYDDDTLLNSVTVQTAGCKSGDVGCASFTTDQFTIGAHHVFAVFKTDGTFGGAVSTTTELDRNPRAKPR